MSCCVYCLSVISSWLSLISTWPLPFCWPSSSKYSLSRSLLEIWKPSRTKISKFPLILSWVVEEQLKDSHNSVKMYERGTHFYVFHRHWSGLHWNYLFRCIYKSTFRLHFLQIKIEHFTCFVAWLFMFIGTEMSFFCVEAEVFLFLVTGSVWFATGIFVLLFELADSEEQPSFALWSIATTWDISFYVCWD